MPGILVHFEDSTLKAIDRALSVKDGDRADFIRGAVKDAIFRIETELTREGYRLQPDSEPAADIWDDSEHLTESSNFKSEVD